MLELVLTVFAGTHGNPAEDAVAPPAIRGSGGRGMLRESAAAASSWKCGDPCDGFPSGASTTKLSRTASGMFVGFAAAAPNTSRVARLNASSSEFACLSCCTNSHVKPA